MCSSRVAMRLKFFSRQKHRSDHIAILISLLVVSNVLLASELTGNDRLDPQASEEAAKVGFDRHLCPASDGRRRQVRKITLTPSPSSMSLNPRSPSARLSSWLMSDDSGFCSRGTNLSASSQVSCRRRP